MKPARNSGLTDSHDQLTTPRLQRTRASLPPKPVSRKTSRNIDASEPATSSSVAILPSRPRRSWSRRSASWTPEEDAKLVQLVEKETSVPPSITASKTWSRVAAQLTNRTGKQCRERYLNQLKPGIRRDPWTPEEERTLHDAHARYGNKWVTIANELPGRTDNCVKNHWNSMLRKRQRREAAFKAVEGCSSVEVQTPLPTIDVRDPNGGAEKSNYTGYATPSGASSSTPDFLSSSGIPSPFTASSPITPRRDAKLQISSLVTVSSKDTPSLKAPYLTRENSTGSGPFFSNHPILEDGRTHMQSLPSETRTILGQEQDTTKPQTLSLSAPGIDPNSPSPESYLAQDSRLIALSRSKAMETHISGASFEAIASAVTAPRIHRQLRRSARLTTASMQKSKAGSSSWKSNASGIAKRASSKDKRHGRVGNPLAALAAAASSVPPSPLTPESRFSGTSRSRSASPCPRAIPDLSSRRPCSAMITGKASMNDDGENIEKLESLQNGESGERRQHSRRRDPEGRSIR